VETDVWVARVGHSSFALQYRMRNAGVECATGKVVVVCMDLATQKARAIPAEFAAALRLVAA
jgi:acyl-CoA thioesterase FadM